MNCKRAKVDKDTLTLFRETKSVIETVVMTMLGWAGAFKLRRTCRTLNEYQLSSRTVLMPARYTGMNVEIKWFLATCRLDLLRHLRVRVHVDQMHTLFSRLTSQAPNLESLDVGLVRPDSDVLLPAVRKSSWRCIFPRLTTFKLDFCSPKSIRDSTKVGQVGQEFLHALVEHITAPELRHLELCVPPSIELCRYAKDAFPWLETFSFEASQRFASQGDFPEDVVNPLVSLLHTGLKCDVCVHARSPTLFETLFETVDQSERFHESLKNLAEWGRFGLGLTWNDRDQKTFVNIFHLAHSVKLSMRYQTGVGVFWAVEARMSDLANRHCVGTLQTARKLGLVVETYEVGCDVSPETWTKLQKSDVPDLVRRQLKIHC